MKINRSRHISIVCALVTAATIAASAQKPSSAPRRPQLVVNIVIDGLDFDRINQLREYFGTGGFNRLLDKGVTIANLDYGGQLDAAAATAVLFTGASPAVSGIPAASVYDPQTRLSRPVFFDAATIGNFTDETFSPAALRVSTIADELRIDGGGLGYVHSVASDAELALAMSGHAGNSAVWINDHTGRWASSTYYTDLPTAVQSINHRNSLASRIDTISWTPSIPEKAYAELPSYKRIYAFRHMFPHNDPRRYQAFKASPKANAEITGVASDYLRTLNLGKREAADMLNISYTAVPYAYGRDADNTAETIDTYIRLDRELATLFGAIDATGPGMDRTLIFVGGTPATPAARRDDERWRIPGGEFSPSRAVSLLKVNLMSIFGNGDWVSGYHDGQIYLNRELIASRGKDLDEFRRETADFMRRMSGVTDAATIDEVLAGSPDTSSRFRNPRNLLIENAGDVFVAVAPGWSIVDGNESTPDMVVRAVNPSSAAFILYPTIPAQTIDTPVDARVVAPTMARLLRIRSPNGAAMAPLHLR